MSLLREVKLVSRGRDWRGRSRTPRSAEQWAPGREPREFPTSWARTRPARVVREGVQRGVLRPLVWSQTQPRVYGADRLSGVAGPVIVIANHASHLDAPLILNALPARLSRRTAVGAAADRFHATWNLGVSSGMVELSLSPRGTSMEKIILLCLIVGLIGVLAELSPVLSSQK